MEVSQVYKTVTLINSLDDTFIRKNVQLIKETPYTMLCKHFKKNVYFLFIKSTNYITYSDYNILIYTNENDLRNNLRNNLILLLENRKELKSIKKIIKDHKIKIIYKDTFINELMNIKCNSIKHNRPIIFAENYVVNEGALTIECFLKEGLVGGRMVINNNLILEIDEIISDDVYKAEEVFKENRELEYERKNYMHEIVDDEASEIEEASEYSLEENENILNYESENLEEESNFSENEQIFNKDSKFNEYLKISDLNNPNLKKIETNDIFIPRDTQSFVNRVIKRSKSFFKNTNVTIKFKQCNFPNNFFPMFVNLYEIEGSSTIYNLCFSSKTEVKREEYFLENDIFNFKISPIITKNKGYKIHLESNNITNGILTFIGPLFLTNKFNIKKQNINCSLFDYSERLIVKEKYLVGKPFKIYKKITVIRGMFTSPQDVKMFINYKLKTDSGVEGVIKESLGTHGLFKAYFSSTVQHGERVKLCLYQQVFLQ